MGGSEPHRERSVPWWWRHQRLVLAATTLVVVGAVLSTYLRTRLGAGPSTDVDLESFLVLLVIAAPAGLLPFLTRRWRIWVPECLLSVAAWILFLTPGGDLSCVDCGFALLIPLNAAGVQAVLVVIALVVPAMRRSPYI